MTLFSYLYVVCVCVYLTDVPLWFGQRSHAIEMVLRVRVERFTGKRNI